MPFKPACIIAISDSSFASLQGGRSQCGHFLLLGDEARARGDAGKFSVIQWRSGRQRRVARSTFGAEMLALADAVDGGDYLRGMLFEMMRGGDPRLGETEGLAMRWATDSKDLYDALRREGAVVTAEKRLALDVTVMKELLERDRGFCHWVNANQMRRYLPSPTPSGLQVELHIRSHSCQAASRKSQAGFATPRACKMCIS